MHRCHWIRNGPESAQLKSEAIGDGSRVGTNSEAKPRDVDDAVSVVVSGTGGRKIHVFADGAAQLQTMAGEWKLFENLGGKEVHYLSVSASGFRNSEKEFGMGSTEFWLSEEQYARLAPLLPNDTHGVPRVDAAG